MRSSVLLPLLLLACSTASEPNIVSQSYDGVTVLRRADIAPNELVVINAVEYRGRFALVNGCLQLVSDNIRYTPVFQNGRDIAAAVTDARRPAGGRSWSIAGGPRSEDVRLPPTLPDNCSRDLFVVVSLSDPR